jgi:hypothetical protein
MIFGEVGGIVLWKGAEVDELLDGVKLSHRLI